ncbi:HdeD family acid-resistance protein [Geodermatophilus sp. URMC 61]|uniref:HdeD family acid-resistance protein n=1 Tax=Geodermatophilus sp. URMC 61 TaxID=3423411 RepID=UPI00406C7A09
MDGGGRTALRDTGAVLLRESARYWWVMVVAGVAWLVVAWLVLRADVGSLAAVGVLIGCVLLAAGVNEAGLASMVDGGWRVLHYVVAALFVLAGLWAFLRPINTFFALASVLGLVLFLAGAFEIARGVASRRENPYWWIGLVSGVLLLLLAVWASSADPAATIARRTFLILFWVGAMALLRGVTGIVLGFALRHLGTTAARGDEGPGDVDVAAVVPSQERRGTAPREEQVPRS